MKRVYSAHTITVIETLFKNAIRSLKDGKISNADELGAFCSVLRDVAVLAEGDNSDEEQTRLDFVEGVHLGFQDPYPLNALIAGTPLYFRRYVLSGLQQGNEPAQKQTPPQPQVVAMVSTGG